MSNLVDLSQNSVSYLSDGAKRPLFRSIAGDPSATKADVGALLRKAGNSIIETAEVFLGQIT